MAKAFEQPPKGPKLGPMQEFKALSPDRKAQLGDLDKLGAEVVSQPVAIDPRIEAEERQRQAEELLEPAPEPEKTAEEVAEEFEILQGMDEPEEPDPIDLAAEPTEDDRRNFMRSILGDKQYEKEYVLFGGMVVLTLVDLSPKQEDSIFEQLAVDQREEIVKTQEDWEIQLDRYRAAMNIQCILRSGADSSKADGSMKDRVENLLQTKNSTMYRSILRAVRVFRRHLDILTERSMQSDFWQVDGLSSPSEPTRQEPSDMTETVRQEVGI